VSAGSHAGPAPGQGRFPKCSISKGPHRGPFLLRFQSAAISERRPAFPAAVEARMVHSNRGDVSPRHPGHDMAAAQRLIKKYPNRRLYDTQTSTYITLADVKQLVLDHEDFQVIDAKTNDDLTRQILLQIILEEESGGVPIFTAPVLSQIIRFYGNAMQGIMGSYLEKNIQAFVDIQNRLQEQSKAFYEKNKIGPEMWAQFVNMQTPMIQSMMSNYIEQSKNLFVQMQENLQNQTRTMFTQFPFTQEKK
jgi:polyhydroxyalkanoate synthesis repressor PhaR